MKNATVGEGAKVPHLTYVGDADIGEHTNIGAATIFVNYDGMAKHRTTIGYALSDRQRHVFVAPVTIGDGAYTAAGSVITEDVPPGALAVARGGSATRGLGGAAAAGHAVAQAAAGRPRPAGLRRTNSAGSRRTGKPQWPDVPSGPGRSNGRRRIDGAVTGMTTTGEKKTAALLRPRLPRAGRGGGRRASASSRPRPRLFDFANGEIFVRFQESVRGCDAFVLQSHTSPINQWIMEQLIMVDALKRASAKRITVVTPFFGYARQDKKHRGREPISARLMADLFTTAGADRLMAVDLHTAQIQGFFDGPVDHLFALPILADYVETQARPSSQVTVVSPDAGRVRVAERWTDRLGGPLAIIHKRRDPDVANQVRVHEVVGEVAGRTCILVDDMIDTGGTIAKAAEALFEQGADRTSSPPPPTACCPARRWTG